MKSFFKKSTFIFIVLIFFSFDISAKEYWVKQGASGDGKSKSSPAGELWKILAGAVRGDVINVAQGEYNGKNGSGEFRIDIPDLTLVGGYNDDFSQRNPFKYLTILRTKKGKRVNYTQVVGGIIGMKYEPGKKYSASGLILDGFVIDGSTRNKYDRYGKLITQSSWKEPLIKLVSTDFYTTVNIKIRNCILVNGYYQGIYVKWWGDQNEVSNTLIVGTMIAGIDNTGTMPGSVSGSPGKVPEAKITMKNNTIAFQWTHDKAQQSRGIKLGSRGSYVIENNVIAYLMKPSGEGIWGTGEGKSALVKGNVFWLTEHPFTGSDDKAQAAVAPDDSDDEEEEEEEGGTSAVAGFTAENNIVKDPGFKLDADYYNSFLKWAAQYDHMNLKKINKDRKLHGFDEIIKIGTHFKTPIPPSEKVWGRKYDLDKLIPNFVSKIKGKGIQVNGPFPTYKERKPNPKILGAVAGKKSEYTKISFDQLRSGSGLKEGMKVKLKIGLGPFKKSWGLSKKGITPVNYIEFIARKSGVTKEFLKEKIPAYIYIGTKAAKRYNKYGHMKVRKKTWKKGKGVWIRGILFKGGYNGQFPYSIVVDYMGKAK